MRTALLASLVVIAGALAGAARADDAAESPLKIEAAAELKFRTPLDGRKAEGSTMRGAWVDVTNGTLPLKGEKGGPIRFELRAPVVALDLDGDGKLETTGKQEVWTVKAARDDGSIAPYTFRLRRDGNAFFFARACMAVGEIAKTPVRVVDENNDGRFDGVGLDAIQVGSAPSAQLLGKLLPVKGELYEVQVDQSGSRLVYRRWSGPTGTLDLHSGYKGKAKPTLAIVSREDLYFDCAPKGGTKVPAGDYELVVAHVGPSRDNFAVLEKGKMAKLTVEAGGTTVLDWGLPGVIEFEAGKQANVLTIAKKSVKVFGKAGEEFAAWIPADFRMNGEVVEEGSGKRIWYGVIGDGATQRLATTVPWKVRLMNEMVSWLGPFYSEWQ